MPPEAVQLQPLTNLRPPLPPVGVRYGLSPLVHSLVTLGAPHQSIEAYPFGRIQVGPWRLPPLLLLVLLAPLRHCCSWCCCCCRGLPTLPRCLLSSRRLPFRCQARTPADLHCLAPSPPQEGLFGQHLAGVPPAVAGSSLQFANHFYPTAESLGGGVRVVCACGHAARGRALWAGRGLWGSSASSSGEDTGGYASLEGGLGGGLGSGCSGGGGWLDEMLAYNAYKARRSDGCGWGAVLALGLKEARMRCMCWD